MGHPIDVECTVGKSECDGEVANGGFGALDRHSYDTAIAIAVRVRVDKQAQNQNPPMHAEKPKGIYIREYEG